MARNPRTQTGRRGTRLWIVVVAAALTLGTPPAAAHAADGDSARFRIVCHFVCGGVAADAAAAAAAAWPLADALFGAAPAGGRSYQIHLYRTPEAFVAARSGLLRPAPRRMAVTEPHSRSAHIALPSGIADTTLAAYGLPGTVLRVVAHEAFHLAALARAPGSARLPAWLVEGAASWAEHEALRALGRTGDAADEPVASTYQWLVQRRLRTGRLPAAASILADSLPELDEQEQYGVRKLFFEYLHGSAFATRLETGARAAAAFAVRRSLLYRAPRPAAVRAVLDDVLLAASPAAALDSIDAGFRAHIESLRPGWVQTGRALDRIGADDWLHVGLAGDATAWRSRYAPVVQLSGSARFLTGGSASVLVDSGGDAHFAIVFDRDASRLRVEHHPAGLAPRLILDEPLPGGEAGEIEFLLSARRGTLELAVAGAVPRTLGIADLEPNGAWGVGVSEGASVVWLRLSDRP